MIAGPTSLVVLGGSGMLGQALCALLRSGPRHVVAPDRRELDLRELDALEHGLSRLSPTAVINAAAFTDVGRAELPEYRDEVYRLNRDAPARLARTCRALDIPLIHLSTDYVFDGQRREPYREEDPTGPVQHYGRSKLDGEIEVLGAHPRAVVARTSTLFGPGRRGRPHYVDAILDQARRGDALEVVRLPVSSPTYVPDLARGLIGLLDAGAHGIVHVVNAGECSRLELAQETVRRAALDRRVEIRERAAPAGGLVRPDYSALDTSRFSRWTGGPLPRWEDALQRYLDGPRR